MQNLSVYGGLHLPCVPNRLSTNVKPQCQLHRVPVQCAVADLLVHDCDDAGIVRSAHILDLLSGRSLHLG